MWQKTANTKQLEIKHWVSRDLAGLQKTPQQKTYQIAVVFVDGQDHEAIRTRTEVLNLLILMMTYTISTALKN